MELIEQLLARRVPLERIEALIDSRDGLDSEQRASLYLYAHGRAEYGMR